MLGNVIRHQTKRFNQVNKQNVNFICKLSLILINRLYLSTQIQEQILFKRRLDPQSIICFQTVPYWSLDVFRIEEFGCEQTENHVELNNKFYSLMR